MNPRILNRAGLLPEDGWYQIEALGEHINHRARVIQVVDEKAITSIINRFTSEATAAGEDFAGQRIDKDHLSQSEENATESLGWAMALRNRDGVPEARINWTLLGRPLIESKPEQPPVYKFFSTEYEPGECEECGTRVIKNKTYKLLRPLRLAGLSLTNDPNNKGQRPISNRNSDEPERSETQPTMKTLLKKMGLSEDASEDAAIAAFTTINNRATSAESERDTIKKERDDLLTVQVDADLEKYKGVIKNRENVKKALVTNRAGTIELLESMQATVVEDPARITNRGGAKTPEKNADAAAVAKEEERAAKISNRASALREANPRLSLTQAYEKAEAEIKATK